MEDRRRFFRIANDGSIAAKYENFSLSVINISSSGALVIKNDLHMAQTGMVDLTIDDETFVLSYEILKIDKEFMTLIFTNEDEIEKLFSVLKRLKVHHKS